MKTTYKIYLVILFSLIVGMLFFYTNRTTFTFVSSHQRLLQQISSLEYLEYRLDKEVLEFSFFLYHNYDSLNNLTLQINKTISDIKTDKHIKEETHPQTVKLINEYEKGIESLNIAVDDFKSVNSTIKNSSMIMLTLLLRYKDIFYMVDKSYLMALVKAVSSILLAENSLDKDFALNFKEMTSTFEKFDFLDEKSREFNELILLHIKAIELNLERFSSLINIILGDDTLKILENAIDSFTKEDIHEFTKVNLLTLILMAIFVLSGAVIIIFLVRIERENRKLISLQGKLKELATKDTLTGLSNRYELGNDINTITNPGLLLLNIDGFKNINSLYGTSIGDNILKQLGKKLKDITNKYNVIGVYRIGGDDFGILFQDNINVKEFSLNLINKIENKPFSCFDHNINVNISAGFSKDRPLIETADMTLKEVKENIRIKYLEYSRGLDIEKKIEENLDVIHIIKEAIKSDNVVLYYQPIFDNSANRIYKYECLVRIKNNKEIIPPNAFLPTAKKAKLYPEITKIVLRKAIKKFADLKYNFSINLSIEDINDYETAQHIFYILRENPLVAKKITFEILEEEGIDNFNKIYTFICKLKSAGATVAIDDFGSGFSNFEYLIKLNVDYLKIDGTLIKNMDKDEDIYFIVQNVVKIAKKLNMKTVAEFVHSEEIQKLVKSAGIDYSQGYHIDPPLADI